MNTDPTFEEKNSLLIGIIIVIMFIAVNAFFITLGILSDFHGSLIILGVIVAGLYVMHVQIEAKRRRQPKVSSGPSAPPTIHCIGYGSLFSSWMILIMPWIIICPPFWIAYLFIAYQWGRWYLIRKYPELYSQTFSSPLHEYVFYARVHNYSNATIRKHLTNNGWSAGEIVIALTS